MGNLWEETLRDVAGLLAPQEMQEFVTPLLAIEERNRSLVVEAPNRLIAEVVRQRYLSLLQKSVGRVSNGSVCEIMLRVRNLTQPELFPKSEILTRAPEPSSRERSSTLLPKYTFRNFVVGASNQFAHAASEAVANQPGDQYNPLFIYGGVGLGKTHLANAIGHEVLKRNPHARVVYLSSDTFMNELITALRRDRMDAFKERFRGPDVLIVDDVQFLAGRERTQEEFFHTFNSLYENHRQIVLTSDKFPKEIPDLEERLRNRFEWGLIADIQPPDMETRVAILEKKADLEGIHLPQDVAIFLASNIDSNVRELEGSLTRLGAFASLNKCAISEELAREVLKNTLRENSKHALTIEAVQKVVCEFFNLRSRDLISKKRSRSVAVPRQLAMYLCRVHTNASFPTIGEHFGGRDHSTAIHATQVVERRLREDEALRDIMAQLERALREVT
jgi:chromosomal replication initiator protein